MSKPRTGALHPEPIEIAAAGDTALLVTLGTAPGRAASRRVLALADRVTAAATPGVVELVPGAQSLMVHFDPDIADADALSRALTSWAEASDRTAGNEIARAPRRRWSIPVCYDPVATAYGLHDLAAVAEATGLAREEVVRRHHETCYVVTMLGFLPGFPYLAEIDPALRLPRRATPRTEVPAGSVAIAGAMTAIYPAASPGGWHILGYSPVILFDATAAAPALLQAGDEVRFRPVSASALTALKSDPARGATAEPVRPTDEAGEAEP